MRKPYCACSTRRVFPTHATSARLAREFSAVFAVRANGREYALKIAPRADIPVLTYEQNMMASEVFWYGVMREQADIRVPDVYAVDDSKSLLPASYFIMELLPERR